MARKRSNRGPEGQGDASIAVGRFLARPEQHEWCEPRIDAGEQGAGEAGLPPCWLCVVVGV